MENGEEEEKTKTHFFSSHLLSSISPFFSLSLPLPLPLSLSQEAIIKSERNAKQLSSAEASERASRGEPVPPGGVVLDPGATVGDDIASLRAHTIKVLAEEAFVERVVYVPPEQEERGGDSGQKKEKEVKAKEK